MVIHVVVESVMERVAEGGDEFLRNMKQNVNFVEFCSQEINNMNITCLFTYVLRKMKKYAKNKYMY